MNWTRQKYRTSQGVELGNWKREIKGSSSKFAQRQLVLYNEESEYHLTASKIVPPDAEEFVINLTSLCVESEFLFLGIFLLSLFCLKDSRP